LRSHLPPTLNARLDLLRRHILVARVLQSTAAIVLMMSIVFLVALTAEVAFGLSVRTLRFLTAALAIVCVAELLRCLVRTTVRRPGQDSLIRSVEHAFPMMEERLLTLAHPSAITAYVPSLVAETEERARDLDFRSAYSLTITRRLGRIAVAALLLAALPAIFWPAGNRFARRFVGAWSDAAYGFTIHVQPDSGYAALGQPLVLEVELRPTGAGGRLPGSATVAIGDREAPMEAGGGGRFAFAIEKMPERLSFQVRAGDLSTPAIEIIGALPIQVASQEVRVTPPPYVADASARPVADGMPFDVVQYSRAGYRFHLDRPATTTIFRWRDGERSREIPVTTNATEVAVDVILSETGPASGELILRSERGIVTKVPVAGGKVWADPPPIFTSLFRISGSQLLSSRPKITPDAVLRIETTVEDAVGLDRLEVQFRVNAGPIRTETLVETKGRKTIAGEWPLSLAGKTQAGDRLDLRLRAVDNRRLRAGEIAASIPPEKLEPQETFEPARASGNDQWISFSVEPKAESIEKQLVLAERDDLAERLRDIRKGLEGERTELAKSIRAGHASPVWTSTNAQQLAETSRRNAENQLKLRALAQRAQATRGWEPLAKLSRDVAERELTDADAALRLAEPRELSPENREASLRQADRSLVKAIDRIDELLKVNEVLAQERLRQQDIESLAKREDDLAKQVETPPKDDDWAKLQAQQEAIAKQFEEWAANHPAFEALNAAKQQEQARKFAADAQKLARDERERSTLDAKLLEEKLRRAFADLAAKQADLAIRTERLDRDLGVGLERSDLPVAGKPARQAGDLLKQGLAEEAIPEQEKTIADLAKLTKQLTPPSPDPAKAKVQKDGETRAAELSREQEKLRDETKKLLTQLAKESGSGGGAAKDLEKLKEDVQRLSQAMDGPEAKALAEESTKSLDDAGKAMKQAQDDKAAGQLAQSRDKEEEAALKLEMAGKKLADAADKMSVPKAGPDDARLAEAMRDAKMRMQKPAMDSSPAEMRQAAEAMRKTAQLAGGMMQRRLPQPAPPRMPGPGGDASLPPLTSIEAWGDLPGEVRARLVQDLRARYGDEYEAIIQQYFRNLAASGRK
jgi:hypothetical protein